MTEIYFVRHAHAHIIQRMNIIVHYLLRDKGMQSVSQIF